MGNLSSPITFATILPSELAKFILGQIYNDKITINTQKVDQAHTELQI